MRYVNRSFKADIVLEREGRDTTYIDITNAINLYRMSFDKVLLYKKPVDYIYHLLFCHIHANACM